MASFNNLEMAPVVAAHPNIEVHKGFLGFCTKVYYRPTQSLVDCLRNYYTVLSGNSLHQFLIKFEQDPSCAEHETLKMESDPNGHYCLEMCVARDGSFFALQLFRYGELEYCPVTDIKIYEGQKAEMLMKVLNPRAGK